MCVNIRCVFLVLVYSQFFLVPALMISLMELFNYASAVACSIKLIVCAANEFNFI